MLLTLVRHTMKSELVKSKGIVNKNVTYEDEEQCPEWMRDIRHMEIDGILVELEPLCVPLVAVGRSLCHHLRSCGLLDGYDPNAAKMTHRTTSYFCKIELKISQGEQLFEVAIEMSYGFRNPEITTVLGVTDTRIVEYIHERIVEDKFTLDSFGMRLKYLLVVQSVNCTINGLHVQM